MKIAVRNKELLVISVAWALVFASTPLYQYYSMLVMQEQFEWFEVLDMWSYDLLFLLLFLLNHYVLVPYLIGRKHWTAYVLSVAVLLSAFGCFMHWHAPQRMRVRPALRPNVEDVRPPHHRHPLMLAPPDLARLVIALLMLGADMGVVASLNEQKMRQRLLLLEQQNLKQELEHLHYQINPHFFMNTLNNIHVLIDLDQELAKRSVVELSKLMRYALYEGNGTMVSITHEIEFLQHYISLMKLRYQNQVEVYCEMPDEVTGEVQMPPLLLATFVENAFKHGVSCLSHSFIHISLAIDSAAQTIRFRCVNSQHGHSPSTNDGHHGIGLENVRKRLDLIYAERYQLSIDEHSDKQYVVDLTLPVINVPRIA